MNKIGLNSCISRKPDLIATDMDGDTVMMSIEHGAYYGVGGVGSRVWELIESPVTVDQIIQTICAEYEVGQVQCQEDMLFFLHELEKNELVTVA